jgi:hypothetical protein
MRPTLTPIEAGPTKDSALGTNAKVDTAFIEKQSAGVRQLPAVLVEHDQRPLNESICNGDGYATGHVVVARPRVLERITAAPKPARTGEIILGHDHETFEHASDERRGQSEIPSSAMLFESEQSGIVELRKMAARRLRRHAGKISELGCGQGPAIHQSRKHTGTRRIADEGGDLSNLGSCIHGLFYTQWRDERRANTSAGAVATLRDRAGLQI